MSAIGKTLGVALVVGGYIAASQAPEFAQQYRQRIGGAVQELRQVVIAFDQDAKAEGRDRQQALADMNRSADPLVQRRGRSMGMTIARAEALETQAARLEQTSALARPAVVLTYPDAALLEGAWEAYEPAMPTTFAGVIWGFFGGLLAFAVAALAGRALPARGRSPATR